MLKSRRFVRPWTRPALGIAAGALLLTAAAPAPVAAYDATTTLAGLTEQAALSSRLHRRLIERMSHSLGLFEPLRLDVAGLRPELAHSLHVRLQALDDGQGYAPESLARQPGQTHPPRRQHALGWLTAGTVIELVPAVRQRHHFFEPRSGRGLFRPPGQTAASAAAQAVRDGMSTTRQLLAGAAVDGTGLPAPDWVLAPQNELSVDAFLNAYERSVLEKTPTARESALAEALLAAGAIVAVLEQTGDPAHVRNDLSEVIAGGYSRYVADHYGRGGVPAPGSLPEEALLPKRLRDLFTTSSGMGLADRTARRFFSSGSLPGTELGDVPQLAGRPPLPSPPFTDDRGQPVAEIVAPPGWPAAPTGYLSTPQLKHLAAWERRVGAELDPRTGEPQQDVRFALDLACYADYAALLLPEIGRYAQVALDYLFRGELQLALLSKDPDSEPQLSIQVAETALGSGTLTVLAEKPEGARQILRTLPTLPTRPGAVLASVALRPEEVKDRHRLVVLFRGRDRHNEPLVTSAQLVLPTRERPSNKNPEAEPEPAATTSEPAPESSAEEKSDAKSDAPAESSPDSKSAPAKEPAPAPLQLKNR